MIFQGSNPLVKLIHWLDPTRANFFLVAKRRKINDRVVPILVALGNWNDVICLSRSSEFAQCVVPGRLKFSKVVRG